MLRVCLQIYSPVYPHLLDDVAEECMKWVKEGYLDPDRSSRSFLVYGILMTPAFTVETQSLKEDDLLERMFDQISVLRQIEGGIKSDKESAEERWKVLPKGLGDLRYSAVACLLDVLKVQGILMDRYVKNGHLINHDKLFWALSG